MLYRKSFWLLCFTGLVLLGMTDRALAQRWNPSHSVGTVSGNYYYQYGQTPDQLVEIYPALISTGTVTYQWQSSGTLREEDFQPVANGGNTGYSPGQLLQTTYYRRKTTYTATGAFVLSNTIKLSVVSSNWEDRNYIREYDVNVTGVTTWQAVDQLPIGQKLQTTSYLDGIGRGAQKVSRGIATPLQAGGLWGDVVKFYRYDELGRETKKYLPYTTTTESGKYKTTTITEQPQYFANVHNETSAYGEISYEFNPLNRVSNVKDPGLKWAASDGNSFKYDLNSVDENVQRFIPNYTAGRGAPPIRQNPYLANTLYKYSYIDKTGVNERLVVEYYDIDERLILKKVQLDNVPSAAHSGWICTYSIYDDFSRLICQLQPEAVKYLDTHNWTFNGTEGQQVVDGFTYQYDYDQKGRVVWQKSPGAAPLNMLYDSHSRIVFSQDGNQAALSTPQWTAYFYDELDRPTITALYNTTKTIAALQADIDANIASPISTADLNNPNITTITKYRFYDDYSFATVRPFNTTFTNLAAYNNTDPNVIPIAPSKRILNLPTGSMVRVLGSNTFLSTTLYFDEKERVIQSLEENVKAGIDITTWQYHFDGRVLSRCSDHTTSGTGYSNFITLSKNNFDILGRITSLEKQFGSNAFKTVATYDFDDMGKLKTKYLDPGYTAGGNNELESLNFSYNLQGALSGINKDYALKNPANYNKWGHFFGMYLGYDNRDNVFNNARLNGQVTGVLWNSQGDDAQRKYDYTYDYANRLTNAAFTEQKRPGEGFNNSNMDFSVGGSSGKITYDLNGNLLGMLQKGVMPGTAAPVTIDDLAYTYESFSNKLKTITDNSPLNASGLNGKFGDFKDGNNGTATDYVYDYNGNLVIDLNKSAKELENVAGANGISYNYLSKPEKIRIAGKGTIRIVYNADGDKLQRAFIPESGGLATVTSYVEDFVYQQTGSVTTTVAPPFLPTGGLLSYLNFEEGRIRVVEPITQDNGLDALQIAGNINLPDGKMGVYDYFIYDYLQNVRMILSEETHIAINTCTMETGRATVEDPVFGQTGGANEVENTRYPKPAGWQNASVEASVSQLGNNAGHNIGPNTLQKVMAGDKVSAYVQYYYQSTTGGDNPNFVSTLLTSLGQAIIGGGAASDVIKANVTPISSQLNGTYGFTSAVRPASDGTTTPRAYLTILFFDERFNFIEAADGGVAQQQVASSVGSDGLPLALGNIKAPKNGYVYVYVSNQSDQDVYFDNLKVGITRGNIIEENHYYAFGLRIAAISSRKPGHINEGMLKNNRQYQGAFSEMDDDIGWNDFEYRSFDAQIGRWLQIDPVDKFTSPYSGMDNDPVNNTDPNGADPLPVPFIWRAAVKAFGTAGTAASTTTAVVKTTTTVTKVVKTVITATHIVVRSATYSGTFINQSEATVPPYLQTSNPTLDSRFHFAKGIKSEVLTSTSINTLNYIIAQLNVKQLTITSTGRTPEKQVTAMIDDIKDGSPTGYQPPGTRVQKVYYKMKKAGASESEIYDAMVAQVYKEGPGNVSGHCADPKEQNAIDFGVNNLAKDLTAAKQKELKQLLEKMAVEKKISKFLHPGNTGGAEHAFHIQIPNKGGTNLRMFRAPAVQRTAPWDNFGTRRTNWVSIK